MDLKGLAEQVGEALRQRGAMLATAESCTGGWVSREVTAVAGSSLWFERGFVTYSNRAKLEMLGVLPATLEQYGAVSEEIAREMAEGALRHSQATVALAISGIAGPDGAAPGKPVGTVCFAWAGPDQSTVTRTLRFAGDRERVREQAVEVALRGILDFIGV